MEETPERAAGEGGRVDAGRPAQLRAAGRKNAHICNETAIIERYRRLLSEMLPGRRFRAPGGGHWGLKSASRAGWRRGLAKPPLQGAGGMSTWDGIYLRRNWGRRLRKYCCFVAIAVNEDGFREVLGAAHEGGQSLEFLPMASWTVSEIVGDKWPAWAGVPGDTVHFTAILLCPKRSKLWQMLKAIHAQNTEGVPREGGCFARLAEGGCPRSRCTVSSPSE